MLRNIVMRVRQQNFSFPIAFMMVFALINTASAVDVTTFSLGSAETSIKALNTILNSTVLMIFKGLLFAYMIWELIEGWINKNLQNKWFSIIGIGVFIAFLGFLPTVYGMLVGGGYDPLK